LAATSGHRPLSGNGRVAQPTAIEQYASHVSPDKVLVPRVWQREVSFEFESVAPGGLEALHMTALFHSNFLSVGDASANSDLHFAIEHAEDAVD
jgi:hypothetical protein